MQSLLGCSPRPIKDSKDEQENNPISPASRTNNDFRIKNVKQYQNLPEIKLRPEVQEKPKQEAKKQISITPMNFLKEAIKFEEFSNSSKSSV